MEPIIYVAIALQTVFVIAFVTNIFSFAIKVIFQIIQERKYKTFNNTGDRRKRAFEKTIEISKKLKEPALTNVQKVYTT